MMINVVHRQNTQTLQQEVYKFINLPLQLLIHVMFVKTVIICGTFNNQLTLKKLLLKLLPSWNSAMKLCPK